MSNAFEIPLGDEQLPPEQNFTEEQKKKYLDSPNTCPVCGSENINSNMPKLLDYENAYECKTDCEDCGSEWNDIYRLSDIEPIELAELPDKTQTDE